jgi:hypothetical protein
MKPSGVHLRFLHCLSPQHWRPMGDNQNPNIHFVGAGTTFCPKMPPKTTLTSIIFVYGSFKNYLDPHDFTTSTEHTQFQQRDK